MSQGIELKLTAFQQGGLDDLLAVAARCGLGAGQEIAGSTETFMVVKIGPPDDVELTAWIYPDECMLTHAGNSYYFENADFSTGEQLRAAFISVTTDLLNGKKPANSGSSRINLFRGKHL